MKTILNLFLILAAATAARGQAPFEGVLEFSTYTRSNQEVALVKWFTKDGSNRLEISSTGKDGNYNMTLLFRKGDSQFYMFTDDGGSRSLFTVPNDSVNDETQLSGAQVSRGEGKKNIAGYNCTLVKVETSAGAMECWVSEEMNLNAANLPSPIRNKGALGALRAAGISGLPLSVINRDRTGETTFSFTVNQAVAKKLDASLFAVPSGYTDGVDDVKKSLKVE